MRKKICAGLAVVVLATGYALSQGVVLKAPVENYEIVMNGQCVGITEEVVDVNALSRSVYFDTMNITGRYPDVPVAIEVNRVEASDETITYEEAKFKIEENILSKMESYQPGVMLAIGDETYMLHTHDEAEDVLEASVSQLMDESVEIHMNDGEVVFSTDNEDILSVGVIEPISFKLVEDTEAFISVEDAVATITQVNAKPTFYEVAKGDVASVIAQKNDMSLNQLYDLNPDLEAQEKTLQIGTDLVIMVPKAGLTITTTEIVSYEEVVEKGYTYQNDASMYVGSQKTISYGANGLATIEAELIFVDGREVNRKIIKETTTTQPTNAVIAVGTKPLPDKGSLGNFVYPLIDYSLTSPFGPRWSSTHRGIDLAANYGSTVIASDGGVVSYSGWYSSYGYLIEIDHGGGVKTRYAHNSKLLVSKGQQVAQNQAIALVGSTGNSTGPHVHFEIMLNEVPVNPLIYLDK